MNALKYIRDTYRVEAYKGGRILYYGDSEPRHATIIGGKHGKLRVRFDGEKQRSLLHPTWRIEYLKP